MADSSGPQIQNEHFTDFINFINSYYFHIPTMHIISPMHILRSSLVLIHRVRYFELFRNQQMDASFQINTPHLELHFQLIPPPVTQSLITISLYAINNGNLFSEKVETAMPTEAWVPLTAV